MYLSLDSLSGVIDHFLGMWLGRMIRTAQEVQAHAFQ